MGKTWNSVNVGIQMQNQCRRNGQCAERIDTKEPPDVKVFGETNPTQSAALQRIHQYQRGMDKEQQHTKKAEITGGHPGRGLSQSSPREVLGKDQQHRDRSQEIQIRGKS